MRTDYLGMKATNLGLIFALVLTVHATSARADHCPEDSIAKGESEGKLAGIGFNRAQFGMVLRQYGPPDSSKEETDPQYPPGSGEASYIWRIGSAQLQVFTMFYREGSKKVESVVAVRVDGRTRVRGLETSRGLRLGDSFERFKQLYGAVYLDRSVNGPDLPGDTRTVCFEDATELGVGIDAKGRVTAIWLAPSIE